MSQNTIATKKTTIAAAGLGFAFFVSLTAGAGAAQAAVADATPARNTLSAQITAQKASRQTAINAGDVALVGQINVQLGTSTHLYDTMDTSVASAQARVVQTKAAKNVAC